MHAFNREPLCVLSQVLSSTVLTSLVEPDCQFQLVSPADPIFHATSNEAKMVV